MFSKKPVLPIVFFAGTLLFTILVTCFLLPLINDSRLILAVAQTITAVFGLMMVFYSLIYFMMKERSGPDTKHENMMFKLTGSVSKSPAKETESSVIPMPMAG